MPYGYVTKQPNQKIKNSGVFSITDVAVKQQEGVFSGSYEHIETKTASAGDGFLRFENLLTDKYDIHYYTFANFQPNSDSKSLRIRLYEGGVEETSSVYKFGYSYMDTATSDSSTQSVDYWRAAYSTGNDTNEAAAGHGYFYNLGDSARYSYHSMMHGQEHLSGSLRAVYGGGTFDQTSTIDMIKFYPSSGTLDALEISLYGIKKL